MEKGFMIRKIASITALALAFSLTAVAKDELPEITEDGLHKMKDTNLGLVYADPDADLSGYQRVMLLDATVAFKKNWQRNQNRSAPHKVRAKDMERIKFDADRTKFGDREAEVLAALRADG